MGSQSNQPVGHVWVTDLPEEQRYFIVKSLRKYFDYGPEQDVGLLESPAEHHALLVVDVVVGRPVHHQELLVGQLLGLRVDVAGLVTSQVVLGSGQTQVSTEGDNG